MLPCRNLYAVPDTVLLHRWFHLRKRNITVLRNSLVWSLRTAPANVGVWYNLSSQVLSIITRYRIVRHCYAAPSVELPVCVADRYLTLRTGCEKHGRKNPLPFPFSKRSHIGNLRQIKKQGKGRSSKRKGNRRCPFLFAPAAGAAVSRAPQSATPSLNLSEKLPARKGRTRLRQFARPGFPVQRKEPPR